MAKKLKGKPTKIGIYDSVKEIDFAPTRDIDFTKLVRNCEDDYNDMFNQYQVEKQKTIAYEQTFNIVMNDLKLINEMATKNLPNDIYKVVVEYLIKEIEQTLQKHIDK